MEEQKVNMVSIFRNQTVRTILNGVESYQGFAFGWLLVVLLTPTLFNRTVGFIFIIPMIINRFYQIQLSYENAIQKYINEHKGGKTQ